MSMRCSQINASGNRCVLTPHNTMVVHVYPSHEITPGKLRTATLERLNYLEAKVEAIRLDLDVVSDTLVGRNETLKARNDELQSIIDQFRSDRDKWKNAASYGWNREAKAVTLLEKAIKALDPIVDFENEDAPAVETRDLIQSALNTLSVINQPEDAK